MLSIKKLIAELLSFAFVEYYDLRAQPINGTFAILPKPYKRLAHVVPNWASVNSFRFQDKIMRVDAGKTSMSLINMIDYQGNITNDSTKVDCFIIMYPYV